MQVRKIFFSHSLGVAIHIKNDPYFFFLKLTQIEKASYSGVLGLVIHLFFKECCNGVC